MDLASVVGKIERQRESVWLQTDPVHADRIVAAEQALRSALAADTPDQGSADGSPVQAARATLAEAEEAAKATEVKFVFEAIGRKAWLDLLADHPPAKADREAGLDHDPGSFPLAAVAASLIEPSGVTPELVDQLADTLSVAQWERLYRACLAANVTERSRPLPR